MYQITTHLESRFPTCPLAIGTKLHEWCSSTRWFCCRGSRMGCELAWFIVGFHQLLLLGRHDRHCKRRLSRPMFLDCIESGIPAVSAAFFGRVKKITQRIGWVGSFRWGHDERIASWRPSSISQPWETRPSSPSPGSVCRTHASSCWTCSGCLNVLRKLFFPSGGSHQNILTHTCWHVNPTKKLLQKPTMSCHSQPPSPISIEVMQHLLGAKAQCAQEELLEVDTSEVESGCFLWDVSFCHGRQSCIGWLMVIHIYKYIYILLKIYILYIYILFFSSIYFCWWGSSFQVFFLDNMHHILVVPQLQGAAWSGFPSDGRRSEAAVLANNEAKAAWEVGPVDAFDVSVALHFREFPWSPRPTCRWRILLRVQRAACNNLKPLLCMARVL